MRATLMSMAGLVVLSLHPAAHGQGTARVGPLPRAEAVALSELADGVMGGKPAGGDAWLQWQSHFLRASDGRVFVPFTLTLDDVKSGFESVAMYVRVVPRGSKSPVGDRVSGSSMATPVSAPESQFSRGNPTAGEASARLALMASELGSIKAPFEGFFAARPAAGDAAPVIRRSLLVAPGEYDLYVAVRERPGTTTGPVKSAVLQQTLSVPDLSGSEPTISSIILAERIAPLARPLSPAQRTERPYAFGAAEVFPDADAIFAPGDVLSVVFFVYNLSVDNTNLPDVTLEYRFRQMSQFGKVFGEMEPQRLTGPAVAAAFDLKQGRQLAVTQALPLGSFPPDSYELDVVVTDNVSGRVLQKTARFMVSG